MHARRGPIREHSSLQHSGTLDRMPKPHKDESQLKPELKLKILNHQIELTVQVIQKLAEGIEANAQRLGRTPTQSEEAAVNIHRATLRRYLQRRHALSCAMHSDRKDTTA